MAICIEPYQKHCIGCGGEDEHEPDCELADYVCPTCDHVGEPLVCSHCNGLSCWHCGAEHHERDCRCAGTSNRAATRGRSVGTGTGAAPHVCASGSRDAMGALDRIYIASDDATITYVGSLSLSTCQDCGTPIETNLLRCKRCDRKHERDSIPFPELNDVDTIGVRMVEDTGCKFAPSCLRCPFEVCRYDENVRVQRARERTRRIAALLSQGLTPEQTAAHEGVSLRTVHRALARARDEAAHGAQEGGRAA